MTGRAALGLGLASGVLALGLWTAWVAAANHAHARDLDARMRACDAKEVWNESLGLEVRTAEEQLLLEIGEPATAPDEEAQL